MTVKEELHHLVETLDEGAAVEALAFVRILAAENEQVDNETAEELLACPRQAVYRRRSPLEHRRHDRRRRSDRRFRKYESLSYRGIC